MTAPPTEAEPGTGPVDLWDTVAPVLTDNLYLVLGTADVAGVPWVSPVFFAARDEHLVYWVSAPGSRHSCNIEVRPTIGITVFDSGDIGVGRAVYLSATARMLGGPASVTGLGVLNARLPADRQLSSDDVIPHGPLAVYEASVEEHYVLIRGGDPRFDNDVDIRQRVAPAALPAPDATDSHPAHNASTRVSSMRTLHFGLRVSDLERSLAFYTAVGYTVVGTVEGTAYGSLTMLQLPGDDFVTIELVHDPATGQTGPGVGINHLVIQVESLEATRVDLAAKGIEPEPIEYPGGPTGPRSCWLTDPDGYRIEVLQWPDGHADGITGVDFI